jgi:hypothetical protein
MKLRYFKVAYKFFKSLCRRWPQDPDLNALRAYLVRDPTKPSATSVKQTIAVEVVGDSLFFALFGTLVTDLRKYHSIDALQIVTRSIDGAIGYQLSARLIRSRVVGWLFANQWVRLNRPVIGSIGYRSQVLFSPISDISAIFEAHRVWRRLDTTASTAAISIDGIQVGDLIVDTYLRFRPSPKFDPTDPFVLEIIWQVITDIRKADLFFRRVRPVCYLSTFATYATHGVLARVAIACGIPVFTFGGVAAFGKKLQPSDLFHVPNTTGYRQTFRNLNDQEQKLQQAETLLKQRLSGITDLATYYMKKSAYQVSTNYLPDVNGALVIFLHDFYDSPHVCDDFIFIDFWSWLIFTVEELDRKEIKFYIKPHPNQITSSELVIQEIKNRYPNIKILGSEITNKQLVDGGIIYGITVYGTVAHELAYLGVPTITCAKHPHHEYDFCRTAKTIEEYKEYILDNSFKFNKIELKTQALEYYYMHNLHDPSGEIALRMSYAAIIRAAKVSEGGDPYSLIKELDNLRALPEYAQLLKKLIDK